MVTLKEPTRVKARKEHKCDCCDKVITVKEEHTVLHTRELAEWIRFR